jgi:hypothetical protein
MHHLAWLMAKPRRMRLMSGSGIEGRFFHVLSRINGRARVLGDHEREAFRSLLRRAEKFSGVEVITWAMLSNHFHSVVHIPEKPPEIRHAVADGVVIGSKEFVHAFFESQREYFSETRKEVSPDARRRLGHPAVRPRLAESPCRSVALQTEVTRSRFPSALGCCADSCLPGNILTRPKVSFFSQRFASQFTEAVAAAVLAILPPPTRPSSQPCFDSYLRSVNPVTIRIAESGSCVLPSTG